MLFPRDQVARLHEMSGPARQVGGKRWDTSRALGPGVDLRAARTGALGQWTQHQTGKRDFSGCHRA